MYWSHCSDRLRSIPQMHMDLHTLARSRLAWRDESNEHPGRWNVIAGHRYNLLKCLYKDPILQVRSSGRSQWRKPGSRYGRRQSNDIEDGNLPKQNYFPNIKWMRWMGRASGLPVVPADRLRNCSTRRPDPWIWRLLYFRRLDGGRAGQDGNGCDNFAISPLNTYPGRSAVSGFT